MTTDNNDRLISIIEEALTEAQGGRRVLLVLNSSTQCMKVAEQLRLRDGSVVTASHGPMYLVQWMNKGMVVCIPEFAGIQLTSESDADFERRRSEHWGRIKGYEFHKGNSRAFTSPMQAHIRLPLTPVQSSRSVL